MTTILIIESNTPDIVNHRNAGGFKNYADCFATTFKSLQADIGIRICSPYVQAPSLSDYEGVDGFVFTGSSVPWCVDHIRGKPLREVMEKVFTLGKPCYGSCNGMQLAALVLGGRVGKCKKGEEIGVAKITRFKEIQNKHPMMLNREKVFTVPTIHRDEVQELPEGAIHLAGNNHTHYQAFAYDKGGINFWGTQYHPELRTIDIAHSLQINGVANNLVKSLLSAESNPESAAQLKTSITAMSIEQRTIELQNWLSLVKYLSV